jgi:hypothetical protein
MLRSITPKRATSICERECNAINSAGRAAGSTRGNGLAPMDFPASLLCGGLHLLKDRASNPINLRGDSGTTLRHRANRIALSILALRCSSLSSETPGTPAGDGGVGHRDVEPRAQAGVMRETGVSPRGHRQRVSVPVERCVAAAEPVDLRLEGGAGRAGRATDRLDLVEIGGVLGTGERRGARQRVSLREG